MLEAPSNRSLSSTFSGEFHFLQICSGEASSAVNWLLRATLDLHKPAVACLTCRVWPHIQLSKVNDGDIIFLSGQVNLIANHVTKIFITITLSQHAKRLYTAAASCNWTDCK